MDLLGLREAGLETLGSQCAVYMLDRGLKDPYHLLEEQSKIPKPTNSMWTSSALLEFSVARPRS